MCYKSFVCSEFMDSMLTLTSKNLRLKMSSALVVCYRYLLTSWTDESIMTNIVNLFQTAPLCLHCVKEASKAFQQTTKADDYKKNNFTEGLVALMRNIGCYTCVRRKSH